MKAVIATDSISLRFRKMLLTFECPQDILINRSRPVHEATGGHAVRDNYGDNEKRLLGKIKGLPLRTWKRKA